MSDGTTLQRDDAAAFEGHVTGSDVVKERKLESRAKFVACDRAAVGHEGALIELVVVHVVQREEAEEFLEADDVGLGRQERKNTTGDAAEKGKVYSTDFKSDAFYFKIRNL